MHNNYYFLRQLSQQLETLLVPAVISECFSQNKNELIVRFETTANSFYIKASLDPSFSCLSFPSIFHRARKNSIDLFPQLIGLHTTGIKQFLNERSFSILLTEGTQLLFKMHGNRSNIIVVREDRVIEIFRKNLVVDQLTDVRYLDREIDWSEETFTKHADKPASLYFTFGKLVWQYAASAGYETLTLKEKWNLIQQIRTLLEKGNCYTTRVNGEPALSMLPVGDIVSSSKDPIVSVNEFFHLYTQVFATEKEKHALLASLHANQKSNLLYRKNASDKLNSLTTENHYKHWADLLMANMHAIAPGAETATVPDFYHEGRMVTIRLKKDLSAQRNAEIFYRKARNQQIEIDTLKAGLARKEKEILDLEKLIEDVREINDLKKLRAIASQRLAKGEPKHVQLPYHEFIHNEYRIWVGRNAQANDELTLKFAYKEDMWLHAKDVPGSHVVVKYQSGKVIPKDVIERAAELAAWNSKRKNESLCPVSVTLKKFVRKRKGDPPGAVVVEREDVIMVVPRL